MAQRESKIDNGLGVRIRHDGVEFAFFSSRAEAVHLCLFDSDRDEPDRQLALQRDNDIWRLFVPGIGAGQLYAYRVSGPYAPEKGLRFNPNKMVLDPYAQVILPRSDLDPEGKLLSYDPESEKGDLSLDLRSNGDVLPRCVVYQSDFDWQGVEKPSIAATDWIIYEVHVKGFTAHPSANTRGTGSYLSFIEKIPYLQSLGVNAVELLPIQEIAPRFDFPSAALSEYWGYNTIGFFAPNWRYSSRRFPGCQIEEFKTLVRELHRAGIAVILDVVYNHTGEGDERGSTFSFRGIDNPAYYALQGPGDAPGRFYRNDAGTGNILNFDEPIVRQMVLDSLRYWSQEMQVDGFRFDLATILGHHNGKFDREAPFFQEVAQDPVLRQVGLIAEPWDTVSYQMGNFPELWAEWNDRYRDTARRFWRGDQGQARHLAGRVAGSADLFEDDHRTPYRSINYITCHDGFTLSDLYSYEQKRNEANLEDNRDGSNNNYSWNCGIEGETDHPTVMQLRQRMIKNAWCLLMMSIGTPMVLGGDEFNRSQAGNNNAYCQDNEISWFNWQKAAKHAEIREFCRRLISLRKQFSVLRRQTFFTGKDLDFDQIPDITWYDANLETPVWEDPNLRLLAYLLDGSEVPSALGNYHLYVVFNADSISHLVRLPVWHTRPWFRLVDTAQPAGKDCVESIDDARQIEQNNRCPVRSRSAVVLLQKG
ncbi:MAG TPA: glycogen debranching protein GlgX [bacterium]|nr:glycogen debranching protein GlgX [bacterium]